MITKGTTEWRKLVKNLENTKNKTNKDVLCIECWQVFRHNSRKRHALLFKDHRELCLTPKHFSSEERFVKLAKAHGKCCTIDGVDKFEDPFPLKRRDIYDLRGTWKRQAPADIEARLDHGIQSSDVRRKTSESTQSACTE